jgi:hypothetical protein
MGKGGERPSAGKKAKNKPEKPTDEDRAKNLKGSDDNDNSGGGGSSGGGGQRK